MIFKAVLYGLKTLTTNHLCDFVSFQFFPPLIGDKIVLGSLAGFVIQATKRVEFWDGLRLGNHFEAVNSIQKVLITSEM